MALGFFIIEQWRGKKWMPVCRLEGYDASLTDALKEVERRNKSGFFRVVQMQRMVWAEKTGGRLRLRKWHASSNEALLRSARAFDREGERRPAKSR